MSEYDAVVVGSGPNGLAAAVELTRSGKKVLVLEARDTIGGGTRTEELTLPGFLHDVCSAIHPLGVGSPFFREIGLDEWIQPDLPVTHPLGGSKVGVLHRGMEDTVSSLGTDGPRYRRALGGFVEHADDLVAQVLGPLTSIPRHPIRFSRFGGVGLLPASVVVNRFRTDEARALIAGLAAHAITPFGSPLTGAVVEMFAVAAHAYGWPLVRGGSQRVAESLALMVTDGGGSIETGVRVESLDSLPPAPIILLDTMPDAALRIGADRIEAGVRRRFGRWKGGAGVFKVDWALDGPIPWTDPLSGRAGTVHVGGSYEEIAASEAEVHGGRQQESPFVIVAQQSLFDRSRVPGTGETAWGYCHVPSGAPWDMTDAIEAQIERFAPGFRDRILGRHVMGPAAYERHNANYVGGDIAGGAFAIRRWVQFGGVRPYRLGDGLYLCSSATPPGAGVHGMCGYHAARAALADRA